MLLSSISLALTRLGQRLGRWSPLALWPNGAASPGMWIDPSLLTASFNDYTGTTPVATPGTVADSANPVGLALDIRAGATTVSDPGNHMLQSTSAARPLESARVNLLTYTEDFGNGVWDKFRCTIGQNATTAPDGTLTADAVVSESGSTFPKIVQNAGKTLPVGSVIVGTYYFKKAEYDWTYVDIYDGAFKFVYFDIDSGVVGSKSSGVVATIEPADNGFFRASISYTTGGGTIYMRNAIVDQDYGNADPNGPTGTGNTSHYVWGAQLELGTTATPYQPILTDGSSYSATGITPFQLYDGVDDGMATASFAAGTLINGMDCMIAVRRGFGARMIVGLYNTAGDARYFGEATNDPGPFLCFSGVGSPTVWVDGVQLSGGTPVTIGTLYNALTVGSWHILEFRGLNLSTWTQLSYGGYPAWYVNGARGDIMLFESTASTEDKDAARQYLADKYGVTLP